jgi:cation:H+ antiporter
VTTIPEASATVAAARMGAADLGVANLYGSCAFNVNILFYADLFYRQGIVVNPSEPAHFVAGGIAIFLIMFGLVLIMARHQLHRVVAVGGWALMASIYILGAIVVARLGAPETGATDATVSLQSQNQQLPYL